MTTTTKKTILTLGTIAAVATPIVAVVSCGSEEAKKIESKSSTDVNHVSKETIKNQEAIKKLLTTIDEVNKKLKSTTDELNKLKTSTDTSNKKLTDELAKQKREVANEIETIKDAAKILKTELDKLKAEQNSINRREFNEKKLNALITAKENEIRELGTHKVTVENQKQIVKLQKELDQLILERFKSVSKTADQNVKDAQEKAKKDIAAIQAKLDEALAKIAKFEKSKADKAAAQKSETEANDQQTINNGKFTAALKATPVVANADLTATEIAAKITDRASLKAELGIDLTAITGSNFTITTTAKADGTIKVTIVMTTVNATTEDSAPKTITVQHTSDADLAAAKAAKTSTGQGTGTSTGQGTGTSTGAGSKTTPAKVTTPKTPVTNPANVTTPKTPVTNPANVTTPVATQNPATPVFNIYSI